MPEDAKCRESDRDDQLARKVPTLRQPEVAPEPDWSGEPLWIPDEPEIAAKPTVRPTTIDGMDVARLLRRTLAALRGGRLGDVTDLELADVLRQACSASAMLFMLPGGRVPLPEERQRFAVSIQPPWQLVAPDGQRYKLADIRFDLAAVHAWLGRKPVQRTSTTTRRRDWN